MVKQEKQKLKSNQEIRESQKTTIPLVKLVPNMVTILNLCIGVSAIRYTLDGRIELAVILVLFAAFLDAIDGRLARLLHADSKFGAQLDSLADVVSFGVAPAIMLYVFSLSNIPFRGVGWGVVLFYISCSALRLARFNSMLDEIECTKMQNYFVGVPITAAAILSLLPIIASFEILETPTSPYINAGYILVIAVIMASRIPTFAAKNVKINKAFTPIIMMLVALIIVAIVIEHWIVIPILSLLYLCSIPISCYCYYKEHLDRNDKDN